MSGYSSGNIYTFMILRCEEYINEKREEKGEEEEEEEEEVRKKKKKGKGRRRQGATKCAVHTKVKPLRFTRETLWHNP
jgi:uncharacterized protein YdaU (DUF1376 family)